MSRFTFLIAVMFCQIQAGVAQVERIISVEAGKVLAAEAPKPAHQPPQRKNPEANKNENKDNKEKDGNKKAKGDDGEKKQKEDDQAPDTVKRPTTPPRVPDPREFDVKPDENARLKFKFHGQPWPDVLQWLASIGGYSLDWQELPNDYLNLSADRGYSVDETMDLINRLLFDRGFTMVKKGDVLSVLRIEKVDPSLLRRVEDESQLMDLPAHDFVKITFTLPEQLKADQAAADVKPLLSKNAKVQPLMATNRLLIIDIVANLRDVSQLVNAEHSAAAGKIVPREFIVQYARASTVADQIMILLGLDPASRRTPQELQLEAQRLQLYAKMQSKGRDVSKMIGKGGKPIYLAVNQRHNSILANAPPTEMAIIERTVKMLDVPNGTLGDIGVPTFGGSSKLRMFKYKLTTLDPESFMNALEEMADLSPHTQLKLDLTSKAVLANATEHDHEKIAAILRDLDGTGREFHVIWLRRLPAKAAAATIHKLMVGEEDDENSNRRSYYGYRDYRYGSRSQQPEQKPFEGFRIDADVEKNRLLLWANEVELEEVHDFLTKMGENPDAGANPNTVRVLGPREAHTTLRLLEQIRNTWPALGNNKLLIEGTIPTPDKVPAKAEETEETNEVIEEDTREAARNQPNGFSPHRETGVAILLAQLSDLPPLQSAPAQGDSARPAAAPITITVGENGRLVLTSLDTKALDRLEDLLNQLAPPPKAYKIFHLKYALASLVTLNLEEYFEGEENFDTDDNWRRAYYGFDFESADDSVGLAKQRKLRFIYDFDTNSILVTNATAEQLKTIEELIEVYDTPPSEDSISARRFKIFKIKHSKAAAVGQTIKEVYRDLLSSKDKEFDKGKGQKEQSSQSTNYYRVYGSSSAADQKPKKIKTSFAGALSIGVDEVSNTLIVSAQEEWMTSISEMIEYLDREAEPYSPTVQTLNTKLDAATLQAALSRALNGKGTVEVTKTKPDQPQQKNQNPEVEAKAEANKVLVQ